MVTLSAPPTGCPRSRPAANRSMAGRTYFRDGITEDIITELSKIKDLMVLPRSAVVAYRDKMLPAQQIGRHLRATYLLAGSIQRAGARLRITSHLLNAETGVAVWAERYD